jgi:crotonobetainyl-CoA:carnitine CoA-transferase CaiB-like acyl-CoA transferase
VIWPCRDGFVAYYLFGGAMGSVSNPALTTWLAEEGLASERMKTMSWADFNIGTTPQEEIDREIVEPLKEFFSRHTQDELWAGGVRRRVMVYPVRDAEGIRKDPQLRDRAFWVDIEHDHLGASLVYPRPFINLPPERCRVNGRAPLIGEHNEEIYRRELGLSLEGIRIVEFGWAVVGPLTTSWAGNYGAQVIKIETRTRPDIIRTMTPFKDDRSHVDNSLFFGRENASKYSLALDLKHPAGVEIAKRLIARSDIVLDSYTAGVMEKTGLGYEELIKVKPDLIMLSSCMYGQTGPWRSMPGYGVPLTAISGLTYLCGWPDRPPTGPYGSYTDYLVPRLNLLALVTALDYRRRNGKGIFLDVAQLEASLQFVTPALLEFAANGRAARRAGNESERAAPHGVFPCRGKDRWCAIAVFGDGAWEGFCRALGRPAWTGAPAFSTPENRKENEGELNRRVAEWTGDQEARTVEEILQRHGVAAAAVNNGKDLGEDPQLTFDRYYRRLDHPEMGAMDYAPHAIEFSGTAQRVFRSPCLGEHTEYVCREILGFSEEEFRRYEQQGVFE